MEMRRDELEPPSALLARAAGELRELTDDGWARAEQGVRARVARALRLAPPVRGYHRDGSFMVAGATLSAQVAIAVDEVPGGRTLLVRAATDDDDRLTSLTLTVSVAYNAVIATVSATARTAAAAAAEQTLGVPVRADQVAIDVSIEDVHLAGDA